MSRVVSILFSCKPLPEAEILIAFREGPQIEKIYIYIILRKIQLITLMIAMYILRPLENSG